MSNPDLRVKIPAARQLIVSCSPKLNRYFSMLPGSFLTEVGGKEVNVVLQKNPSIYFDGVKVDCTSDLHIATTRENVDVYYGMLDKLCMIESYEKPRQLVELSNYAHSPVVAPNFFQIPTETATSSTGRSYSNAAFSKKGIVIKSANSADGENQIMIRGNKGADLPEHVVNEIYYWIGTSLQGPADNPTPTQERVKQFADNMSDLGYQVHNTTRPACKVNWLQDCTIQPLLDVKAEYRAFIFDGKVEKFQFRPRNDSKEYQQLRKGPDVDVTIDNDHWHPILAEVMAALPKFAHHMNSVDVVLTNDGKWSVFEFGMGYSALAANFTWISEYFKKFIVSEINKRFK